MRKPSRRRRDDSLIGQVVAANVVLVTLTLLTATLVAVVATDANLSLGDQRWQVGILALAIVLTFCVNLWMLQKRFDPLERLVDQIEALDPSDPANFDLGDGRAAEIDRLAAAFRRLLRRIDAERRRSGKLVLRGQEEERRRFARDLHDEVNQALTGILLRLEALREDVPPEQRPQVAELKALTGQAMDELLRLARQLRPAALDDHGLAPAIEAQARGFAERTGIDAHVAIAGDPERLDEDTQIVVYRIAQEALSNAAQHARPGRIDIELSAGEDSVELRVRDDGAGFDPRAVAPGGLGLDGMAERARLAGGALDLRSARGAGTELTLRLPA